MWKRPLLERRANAVAMYSLKMSDLLSFYQVAFTAQSYQLP
jgi:hypothetical protein